MVKAKKKVTYEHAWRAVAVMRMLLGYVFVWAFFDKLLGLGYATTPERAWVNGGSPTEGFLSNVQGPFADFFNSLAGSFLIDWLFMVGLLAIGAALIAGIGLRIAAIAGSTLLVLMWMASMPLQNNPFIDDHIVYAAALWVIALAPRKWSVVNEWLANPTVKKNPWLW